MTLALSRRLGRTGVLVPPLTLGTMNFGRWAEADDSIEIIHAAIDAGVTVLDTADVYGNGQSEEIGGTAIAPHTEQLPYSLLVRGVEREVFPVVQKYGVGVISYGPLAAGWLSGRYRVGGEQPASARADLIPGRFDISLERNQRKLAAADAL